MIKIVLVDDQPEFSEALKYTLERSREVFVVGCALNGHEALELCKMHNPDVVLMDLQMPNCDGAQGTLLIKNYNSKIKVIILTTFNEDEGITMALKNGADSYVLKEIATIELVNVIKSVINGFGMINNEILTKISKMIPKQREKDYFKTIEHIDLDSRELDVIEYVVEGLSNSEIAEKLGYAEGTIKNIMSRILLKIGVKDRTQLAVYAIKNNLV
ncbi:response regulator transcription factor [Clostridium beijerinckii]|uniref:response regulator transcription factor n=1 Tax=Clostridium beijerinckii TaxID=1520 RepID=UPI0022E854F7|nr:response regulator transcription factor [Clostridium beijerinckii]